MRLSLALFLALCLSACGLLPEQIDETRGWSANKLYSEAKSEIGDGNYEKAIKLYEKLESRFPYGRYAQQAQLEIAYAYYKDKDIASAIAAADRFAPMILRQVLEATRQQYAEVAESLAGIVEVFQEGVEARGVGRLPDELVKIAVDAYHSVEVFHLGGCGHLIQDGVQAFMVGLCQMRCRQPRRQSIQHRADVIDLDDLALRELIHHRATVRRQGYEASGFKPVQRLADRHAAHADFPGEFVRDQALSGLVAAAQDGITDRVIHNLLHGAIGAEHDWAPCSLGSFSGGARVGARPGYQRRQPGIHPQPCAHYMDIGYWIQYMFPRGGLSSRNPPPAKMFAGSHSHRNALGGPWHVKTMHAFVLSSKAVRTRPR